MKIAFPSNNQKTIASHIGIAKGFLIVDTDTGEKFYIENPVLQKIHKEGINLKNTKEGERGLGTGRVIPPLLAEAGVDLLVASDFGEGMIRNLAIEGIKAIQTDIKDIEEFLNQIKQGDMREVTKFDNYPYGYGYGRRFKRGLGHGRGLGYGRGRGFGYGRRFGFRGGWED